MDKGVGESKKKNSEEDSRDTRLDKRNFYQCFLGTPLVTHSRFHLSLGHSRILSCSVSPNPRTPHVGHDDGGVCWGLLCGL